MQNAVAFLAVSLVVIMTPGQDTALTIRNTVRGGRRGGVATAFGVTAGQVGWALATSLGLSALLLAWQPAFVALRLLGAAYLIFLGVQALRSAFTRSRAADHEDEGEDGTLPRLSVAAGLRQGVLSNLGNPKMAVFFTSLLPQFAPPRGATFLDLLLPGLVFASLTLTWLCGYAALVAKAGDVLRRPRVRRTVDAVMGTALVAFGLRVVTDL